MVTVETQTSTWLLNEVGREMTAENTKESRRKKGIPWTRLSPKQKLSRIGNVFMRCLGLCGIMYIFVCSLGLLEDSFKLLGGRAVGEAFQNSNLLSNHIAGLMIGVLATVLVQSSSTATSIVVAMVASEVIPLKTAIPIVMGTNVGTSVTSTLVSLAQAGERNEFRRAFAGATVCVHLALLPVQDMFNWSAVIVLLPVEIATGYLYHLTKLIVESMNLHVNNFRLEMLGVFTQPLTRLIIEVNRDVITDIAMDPDVTGQSSVLKRWCEVSMTSTLIEVLRFKPITVDCNSVTRDSPFYQSCTHESIRQYSSSAKDSLGLFVGWNDTSIVNQTLHRKRCNNLFALTDLDDKEAGCVLLVVSTVVILFALFGIVKVLHSLLMGPVAKVIKKTVNADFPGKLAYFTGYVALLVGCGLTVVIQSSSVFTSTLTPLVGVGIVSVERVYPMTLGSNIGTTVTGILAAMSTKGNHMAEALQIALCHLFFNISSVLIFYPIPFMRFPISFAKTLGHITAKYRWFAGMYLIGMFLVIPGAVFALSYAGWAYLVAIAGPLFFMLIFVNIVNVLQVKRPQSLPKRLRSWDFLPRFCHSWAPYDRVISCKCVFEKCPNAEEDRRNDDADEDVEEIDQDEASSTAV